MSYFEYSADSVWLSGPGLDLNHKHYCLNSGSCIGSCLFVCTGALWLGELEGGSQNAICKSAPAAWLNKWHASVSWVLHKQALYCTMQTYACTQTRLASITIKPLLCMWTRLLLHPNNHINNILFTSTFMTRAQLSILGFLGAFLVSTVFSARPCTMLIQLGWIPWMKRTESMWTKCQSIPQSALFAVLLFIYLFIQSVSRWPGPTYWKRETHRFLYTHFQVRPCY